MKKLLLLGLLMFNSAFAADTANWVEISAAESTYKVYVDVSKVIVDQVWSGYKVLMIFPEPIKFQGLTLTSEITIFGYDCFKNEGAAKRLVFIDEMSQDHALDEPWRTIKGQPALHISEYIKKRVCAQTT